MPTINWIRCEDRLPTDNMVMLVTGPSGYQLVEHGRSSWGGDKFLTLAFLDRQWRPWVMGQEPRWQSVSHDALSDCGWYPTHWALPAIPEPQT